MADLRDSGILHSFPYNAGPFPPDTHVWVLNKAICCGEGCQGATCETPNCPCANREALEGP